MVTKVTFLFKSKKKEGKKGEEKLLLPIHYSLRPKIRCTFQRNVRVTIFGRVIREVFFTYVEGPVSTQEQTNVYVKSM